jgi:hypothetical protein
MISIELHSGEVVRTVYWLLYERGFFRGKIDTREYRILLSIKECTMIIR